MSTGRLEAFSDGVIAIAITLLVLDIHVPGPEEGRSLAGALGRQWPEYVAYAVSFLTIGVIWVNHHAMLRRLAAANHTVLVLNVLLLMTIALLPFTTALMAVYLRSGHGDHLAAAIYAGSFLTMGVTFFAMQRYVLFGAGGALVQSTIDQAARDRIRRRNQAGLVPYAVAVALAPLSAYATFAVCGAVALFYAWPTTTSE